MILNPFPHETHKHVNKQRKKFRILYLVSEDWYFVSHRLGLARAARDAGCEIIVVTRTKDHAELIKREGFKLVSFLLPRSRLSIVSELKSIINLIRVYRMEKPDLVHHVALKPSLYGTIAATFAHVPLVVNAMTGLGFVFTKGHWKQSLLEPAVRFIGRLFLNHRQGRIIVQNPDDSKTLQQAGLGRQEDMTLIRGSGVSLDNFKPLPDPQGFPTVAMVSRMLWNKGVGELVDAARLLKQRGVKVRILLIGMPDPENPSSIAAEQLCEWHDEGLIQWRGFRDNVNDIWRQAHIAVLPSYREGLPKSLLEAAACARPIVATDVPGCREIVKDGENGFLVPVQDPEALANALEGLIKSPSLRKNMGAVSRKLVEDHFHEEMVIHKTLKVYEELLQTSFKES